MNISRFIPGLLLCLLASGCVAPLPGESDTTTSASGSHVHISLHSYPYLEAVPGLPVYYAPRLERNYFFYDGLYWVYERDHWYASDWYSGPWITVRVEYVPVFLLRVPVRYYRRPPPHFHAWHRHEAPRWGEHWGPDWERRHPGWRQGGLRDVPPRAPLPDYQRAYRGRHYPDPARQRELQRQHYRYQPRERLEGVPPVQGAPREAWQQEQAQWQERRDALRQQELLERESERLREREPHRGQGREPGRSGVQDREQRREQELRLQQQRERLELLRKSPQERDEKREQKEQREQLQDSRGEERVLRQQSPEAREPGREWRGEWRRSAPGQLSRERPAPEERWSGARPESWAEEWRAPPARPDIDARNPVPAEPPRMTPLPRQLHEHRSGPAREPRIAPALPERQRDRAPPGSREPAGAPFAREQQRDIAAPEREQSRGVLPSARERQQEAAPAPKTQTREAVRERVQEARDRVREKAEGQEPEPEPER